MSSPLAMLLGRFTATIALVLAASGCRDREAPRGVGTVDAAVAVEEASAPDDALEGGHVPRTVETRAEEARLDAGMDAGIDPFCEGAALGLLAVATDPRCEIGAAEWRALASVPVRGLRQDARRDGEVLVVSIVNLGTEPVVLPLRFNPAHPDRAFTVLAETGEHAVFELAPPTLGSEKSADGGVGHVYSTRVRLAAGGGISARVTIDLRIVKRLDRKCGDAGECFPKTLPAGKAVLHVGTLLSGVDVGPPARVDLPARLE